VLRGLIAEGQQLSQQAEAPVPQGNSAQSPAAAVDLSAITGRFKALAAAAVPLSQELIIVEQSRANLIAWQTSVIGEYDRILHSLLLRIVVIAIALGLIVGSGELWTKATNKYVRDIRRRRQLLIVRRVVVGFLSVIVVLFGFVTQFNSLATFAGFITAGIAVGLQTILLSVAAYFFIIGRYGIKVGDRITIATVTGDVIDVGLVRFYVMELAGSSTELNPTGRIAVFSNAVLFQAGTPLYKQLPGTGYAWHELIVRLTDSADYRTVCAAIVQVVQTAYQKYRDRIVREHDSVQNWMQTTIDSPEIQSRLQFSAGVFQFWVRFPVEIRGAAQTDEQITRALLDLMASNPEIKSAVAAVPTIQASVRG
jgi:small-conductance mechanosensitive channel